MDAGRHRHWGVGGIGAACGGRVGRLGARLVLADRSLEGGEELVRRVREAGGEAVLERAGRAGTRPPRSARAGRARRCGRIDFLLAMAGIADQSSVADGDPERWRAVVETNVLGLLYSCRAVVPTMQRQGSGHIVIMASVSGRDPYVGEPVYIASKWAQVGFAHSLRLELLAAGIRVTLVEPGLVDTPLTRGNPKVRPLLDEIEPLTAEDVAQAVVYAYTSRRACAVTEIVVRPQRQQLHGCDEAVDGRRHRRHYPVIMSRQPQGGDPGKFRTNFVVPRQRGGERPESNPIGGSQCLRSRTSPSSRSLRATSPAADSSWAAPPCIGALTLGNLDSARSAIVNRKAPTRRSPSPSPTPRSPATPAAQGRTGRRQSADTRAESHANAKLDNQLSEINTWIAQGVGGIIVLPLDNNAMLPLIKKAHAAGVKFLDYSDNALPGVDGWVIFNNLQGAQLVGT